MDCPIWNYRQSIDKEDSRYLYILQDYNELPEKHLDDLLDKLWWEYLEEKGIDDNFKLAYEYKIRLRELEFEQAQGIDRSIEIFDTEQNLKDMSNKKGQKLSEQLAILSKFKGGELLDPMKTTVYQFIGIEKLFIQHGKQSTAKG